MATRLSFRGEWLFYVAVGAGMALSNSAFAMVSGLFAVTGTGPALVALLVAGVICTVIGAAIGELASMWPSSPAVITYFRAAFGPVAALVLVHAYLLFVVMIAGVESYGFAMVVQAALPAVPPTVSIVVLMSVVVLTNLRGLDLPRRLQILTAFGTMAVLLVTATAALWFLPEPGITSTRGLTTTAAPAGWAGLPAAIALAIFIYTGFEWVTPIGLSRQAYARRVPIAMLVAIGTLLVTYGLFVAALGTRLPHGLIATSATPQVPLFTALLGSPGIALAVLVGLGAIVSTFNAGIMGGAQLLQALAREGSLPRFVARVQVDTGTPVGAVLVLGSLGLVAALLIAAFDLYLVVGLVGSAIICLIYAAYVGAVERLRRCRPELARPFRSRLPGASHWAVIVLMPLIAVASLFTVPAIVPQTIAGVAVAILLVTVFTLYSRRSQEQAAVRAPVGAAR